jgi:hypothetical protein
VQKVTERTVFGMIKFQVNSFRIPCEREELGLGMVSYAYNPKYLGGRDWEDHGLKPA